MGTILVKGTEIEVGEEGFLANVDDWNRDVAEYLAEREGIQMSDQHWEIAKYLHEYYRRYQIAPMIKILTKEISRKYGPEKGTTKYLFELYPAGPAKQACKIAGLPSPAGCL